MMGAPSRNHLYRRRSQVMIDAGPRNHLYLLGQQVKIRSCPRNQRFRHSRAKPAGSFCFCSLPNTFRTEPRQDRAKLAMQHHLHLATPGTGDERHALDQGADRSAASRRSSGCCRRRPAARSCAGRPAPRSGGCRGGDAWQPRSARADHPALLPDRAGGPSAHARCRRQKWRRSTALKGLGLCLGSPSGRVSARV